MEVTILEKETTPPKELTMKDQDILTNTKKTYVMDKALLIKPNVLE